MRYFHLTLIAGLSFFFFTQRSYCQLGVGAEAGYVLALQKEAFAGRIFFGDGAFDSFRIGAGGEIGKFNSKPTGRVLPYYSLKLGVDFNFTDWLDVHPYIGADFEYLRTTRVINESRVSIFPRLGARFFNVLFLEISADNLNEPGAESRFFSLNMNAFRVTLGFNVYSGF